jgi:drug/metabolite transporter (DMT)-like permease
VSDRAGSDDRPTHDRLPRTAQGTNLGAFTPADWGLLATCTVIWGSSFFFIELALDAFSPGLVTFLRVGLGALALALVPAAREAVSPGDWPRLVLLGLIWVAIPFTLFPVAQQWIASSMAGMLNAAMPIFTALVSIGLARRLPGIWQAVGLAIGLVGILAIGWESLGEGSTTALGVVLVMAAVTCYAVSVNLAVPLQQRYGTLRVMLRVLIVAGVLTAPGAAAGVGSAQLDPVALASVAVLGFLGTGLAFVAMGTLAGRVGATRASITTYLMPIVSIALGALVLDERVPPSAWAGIAFVLAGAWAVTRAEQGRSAAVPAGTDRRST